MIRSSFLGVTASRSKKTEGNRRADKEGHPRIAAEEAQGEIRWLRPEYQAPEQAPGQRELGTPDPKAAASRHPGVSSHPGPDPGSSTNKQPWPKTLQAQIRAVRDQLETAPMDAGTLASHYKRKPEKSVVQVLDALTELGMVKREHSGTYRLKEG